MHAALRTVLFLSVSNLFMTFAWYGHLKFLDKRPLWAVILLSWGVAFFEYCFQVPGNRAGAQVFSGYQLKILQEIITLVVFVGFARAVFGEGMRWNYAVSFLFLAGAAYFAFGFSGDGPLKH
ncbi:MAG: DMT family protein [Verrucomicrobium sp.]|nr:DMT family protein [Verrucomicrobium sp.]